MRLAAGAVGLVLLVGAWLVLAPSQLGGPTSYALVVGNSMEPALERGDLAVVRAQRDYRPGDVVLYDSPELGSWVLHRIVRVEGDRYVFKGDANGFVDAERLGRERIVGRLAFAVPGVGAVAEWLRVPLHAALLVGLTALLALTGGAGVGLALRRGRRNRTGPDRAPRRPALAPGPVLLAVLGAAAAGFLLLGALAFGRPETRVDTVEAHTHHGTLGYSATVRRSPVYPEGRVESGDAVFLELVPRLELAFDYRLAGDDAPRGGSIRLDARLSDGAGWDRLLPVVPQLRFAGAEARAAGALDLAGVRRLLRRVHELTGTSQQVYTLTFLPRVDLAGGETFAPELAFELGEDRLRPAQGAALERSRAAQAGREAAATLSLGPLRPTVARARWAALSGLAAALLLIALVLVGGLRERGVDEAVRIRRRYGRLLVPVSAPGPGWARATELATIEGLAHVAALHGRPILHLAAAGTHRYAVEDGPNVFLYRVDGDGPPAFDELPFFEEGLDEALARPLAELARRA